MTLNSDGSRSSVRAIPYQPRHQWRPTRLGMPNDRACFDGERPIGRIYKISPDALGHAWYWTMHAHGDGIIRTPI